MSVVLPEGCFAAGRVTGVFGVHGWVRVYSYTDPRENIIGYRRWMLKRPDGWMPFEVIDGRPQGKGVVVHLDGVADRDEARLLMGSEVAISRDQLPPPEAGEYYWSDLEGLTVMSGETKLGVVSHLVETGANDVLVVKGDRERLVPFVLDRIVRRVDLAAGVIEVDWDPDF